MKTVLNRHWTQAARSAALAALLCLPSLSWGQPPGPPPPPPPGGPPIVAVPSAPEPLFTVPDEFVDRAFERYVDVKALRDAYLTKNAALMTDVGLELLEGERVLLRSHRGLKASTVFEAALRVATDQIDVATLDRLSKVAEKIGDKTLGDKVKVSRQLADKPRAAEPPVPAPDENLPANEVIEIQNQMERFERARAVGDVAGLKALQVELKERPGKAGSLSAYLAKQVNEVVASLGDAEGGRDDVVTTLGKLSGTSRGLPGLAIGLERKADWSIPVGAKAYQRDGRGNIYVSDPSAASGNGINQWVPEKSFYAIKGRFGSGLVNLQWTPGSDGKQYFPYDANPDYVNQATWNQTTQKWDMQWVGMKDALPQTLSLPTKGSNLVASGGGNIQIRQIVSGGGGNFTYREIIQNGGANLTMSQILNSPNGANFSPPDGYFPYDTIVLKVGQMKGGWNLTNLVAAGGGNFTIQNMVTTLPKGIDSKLTFSGDRYLVAAGGGNVLERLSKVANVIALGDYRLINNGNTVRLIGDGGGTLIGQDGAGYSLQSTGPFANAKVYK